MSLKSTSKLNLKMQFEVLKIWSFKFEKILQRGDLMDNEFGDKTQPSLKSKFVDVRIVLTDLEYIEPISRAVSNFDLSNFNVIVS